MEQLKTFWETCDTTFAHLTINKHLISCENLVKNWDDYFLVNLNSIHPLANKSILDYGIGGGYLGIHLHEKYQIKKYIGVDISERQLKFASNNLQNHNIKNYELLLSPIKFNEIKCDVFISQAVIQHFPDINYLNEFLNNINESNISLIMLQIRHKTNTLFTNNNYDNIQEVVRRCHTNHEYIQTKLTKYTKNTDIAIPILSNGYQFLFYQLK